MFLSIFASLLLVFFQYYLPWSKRKKAFQWTAFFRFLTYVGLFLLLFNPSIERLRTEVEKQRLYVLLDDSESIGQNQASQQIQNVYQDLKRRDKLSAKFELSFFSFGKQLQPLDSLSFSESQTDQFQALKQIGALARNNQGIVLLVSDGTQTNGQNYTYSSLNRPIYTIGVGDARPEPSVKINYVNHNPSVQLGNDFNVEAFLEYTALSEEEHLIQVKQNDSLIVRTPLLLPNSRGTELMDLTLPTWKTGSFIFEVEVLSKSTREARASYHFELEVLEKKQKVALVYGKLHPDLGAWKRSIESGSDSELVLLPIGEKILVEDFSAFIFFQPDPMFEALSKRVINLKLGLMIVADGQADWTFVNTLQPFIERQAALNQAVLAHQNLDFSAFELEDLSFAQLPPINGILGQYKLKAEADFALNTVINGVATKDPLLLTGNVNDQRLVLFSATGLWKWRAFCFQRDDSFERFDRFIEELMVFIQTDRLRKPLEVFHKAAYFSGEAVRIEVKAYDQNLKIDRKSNVEVEIAEKKYPMILTEDKYLLVVNDLPPGNYPFQVTKSGSSFVKKSVFQVLPYSMESQIKGTDFEKLQALSLAHEGNFQPFDQREQLYQGLLEGPQYTPVEKQIKTRESLIDWRWLFVLIVLSLSIEWVLRKRQGLA